MKRQLLRVSALLLLLTTAVSCGDAGTTEPAVSDEGVTTAASVETEEVYDIPEPDIPETDFGGGTFTFLINGRATPYYHEDYIFTEQANGEVVNDAVYERNLKLEEKFNVHFALIESDYQNISKDASTAIKAADAPFQMVVGSSLSASTIEGYYHSFLELPNVNLDAEYWNGYCVDGLSVGNKLFLMSSDLTMDGLMNGRFLYFNKRILNDYDIDLPYIYVENNNWTVDNFLSMVKQVSVDVNGDGKFDEKDQYGMLTENGSGNGNILHLSIGAGQIFTRQEADGNRVIAIDAEKEQALIEKLHDVLTDSKLALDYQTIGKLTGTDKDNSMWTYSRQLYAQGHFLFVQNGMGAMNEFRDMADDYGIAPNPKYDEAQERYYHRSDPFSPMMALPVTNNDLERTGALLEYGSWLSHYTVLPAYYEVTVKQKRVRDERDIEMADIIKNSIYYEFADFYSIGFTDTLWTAYDKEAYASNFAKKEKSINKAIEKIMTKLADME